jgi:membrane-associated protease RseP (regulator of RpoE activity)
MKQKIWLHILLFVVTFVTTTLAGAEWTTNKYLFFVPQAVMQFSDFLKGMAFSLPFLGILTAHEFGHYFTAKYYKVRSSLPFYLPAWFAGIIPSFGTFGAVIRIIDRPRSRKEFFDIGIAGPLAGFVVALGVLWYGFSHLPPLEYIYEIHPEYKAIGLDFSNPYYKDAAAKAGFLLGDNLLFSFFKNYVADPTRLPPAFEIMHYPWLLAGYLSLFFTALNLLPVGQLDGGHILYGLVGKRTYQYVSMAVFGCLAFGSGMGLFTIEKFGNPTLHYGSEWTMFLYLFLMIYFLKICFQKAFQFDSPSVREPWILALGVVIGQILIYEILPYNGSTGYFLFLYLLARMGIYHPEVEIDEPLDWKRQVLGWISLLIFVLCFSPTPFEITA